MTAKTAGRGYYKKGIVDAAKAFTKANGLMVPVDLDRVAELLNTTNVF